MGKKDSKRRKNRKEKTETLCTIDPNAVLPWHGEKSQCRFCRKELLHPSETKKCGACKSESTFYCGKDCQRNHWPKHKNVCGKHVATLLLHTPGTPVGEDHPFLVHLVLYENEFNREHSCNSRLQALEKKIDLLLDKRFFGESLSLIDAILPLLKPAFQGNILFYKAKAFQQLEEYKLALEYFQKSLLIEQRVFGENSHQVATTMENIGIVHRKQGEYKLAVQYYEKSLLIKQRVFGENSHQVATAMGNIGIVHHKQGEYKLALEYFQKSLLIFERVFGENSQQVATTMVNIGNVHKEQGVTNR